MAQQNRIGTVVANYDVGGRGRRAGRGFDDHFEPDVERLDQESAQKWRKQKLLKRGIEASSMIAGALVVAAAAVFYRKWQTRH